jgi:cytochrome c oxidase subunit IV
MAKTPLQHDGPHGEHHITQPSEYWKTFGILTILMIATIAVALWVQFPDIGIARSGVWINNLAAIGIATAKALFVIMVFMGVKHSTPLTKVWVVAGFLTFMVMFFIGADYVTRKFEPAPSWDGTVPSALPREIDGLRDDMPDPSTLNVRPRF